MFNLIAKTIILYFAIIVTMRLMGKKQAGQLQPYELVITLLLLYYFFSWATLKSRVLRVAFCGKPSILICKGKLQMEEIRRQSYSLNDLLEQLRSSGITKISDILYAILETNGTLSVIPYAAKMPPTAADMNITVTDEEISVALILDGMLMKNALQQVSYTEQQLIKILHTLGYKNIKEIFALTLSPTGELFLQDMKQKTQTITLPKKGEAA